jgi:predicted HTH domain antitoxin
MQVTIEIPDEIAEQIEQLGGNAKRELLEAFAVEEYRKERLSRGQISELLGLNFWETEEFLRQHETYLHYDLKDLEQDGQSVRKLLSQ